MPDYLLSCGVHTLHMPVPAPDAKGEQTRRDTAAGLPCRQCLTRGGLRLKVAEAKQAVELEALGGLFGGM